MASLRDFTVQEVLNKRYVRDPAEAQTMFSGNRAGADNDITDPWTSARCFNTGATDHIPTTAEHGSAAGSGLLSGGTQLFSTMACRVNNGSDIANGAVEIAANELDVASFPTSGTLYAVSYDSNKPIKQKLSYTGFNGTTFTGIPASDWVGTAGLLDNDVLSLYKDENGTIVKGKPRAIDITFDNWNGYIKFNDPDNDAIALVHSSTYSFEELSDVEDIFFAAAVSGTGANYTVVFTIWY